MEFVTLIWNVAVGLCNCICTSKHAAYIFDLEDNLHSLRENMTDLKNVYEDVKIKVQIAEQRQQTRTEQVKSWLESVEAMENEENKVVQSGAQEIQTTCLGGYCPKNCCDSYKLGKMVTEKLAAVTDLLSRGRQFDVVGVAHRLPRGPVDERPMAEKTVGLDLMFAKVGSLIEDENVGMVGLYGMGGVGKTTLLKRINNEFPKTSESDFDVIIWVVVSRPASVEKIQEVILRRLQIPEGEWRSKTEDERSADIFSHLKEKKFMLLFDDIWERIDLARVGVSLLDNQKKSKIVFTTRSEQVCNLMRAHRKIKVEPLSREEALTLFRENVGADTLNSHPEIPKFAEKVADECQGLPLALVVIARAMTNKNKPSDWEKALKRLKSNPSELSGMDEYVFHILKYSYFNLSDDVVKSCFVYFSTFKEDYEIVTDDLIQLWFGEGFLNGCDDIYEARERGHDIIEILKLASLLETGQSESYVKMHDLILELTLWLARDCGQKKNKIVVLEDVETSTVTRWKEAEKISIWDSNMEQLQETPSCPNLSTLLIRDGGKLRTISSEFFQYMPVIRVLDLSRNYRLTELPVGIGKLNSLEYLNLSRTSIAALPIELKYLTKLRCLLVASIHACLKIPRELVLSLSSLQVFDIYGSLYGISGISEKELVEELDCLEHLMDVSITLNNAIAIQSLQNSSCKLQSCIRGLMICKSTGTWSLTTLKISSFKHLELFYLDSCDDVEIHLQMEGRKICASPDISNTKFRIIWNHYHHHLRHISISVCQSLLDLTSLIYAPSLQSLFVGYCNSIEEIVKQDDVCGVEIEKEEEENLESMLFSRLTTLILVGLRSLKSIYGRVLPFSSLVEIRVDGCPNLRKLPFDSNSAKSIKKIKGEASWWDGLQWEDAVIESHFRPYFTLPKFETPQRFFLWWIPDLGYRRARIHSSAFRAASIGIRVRIRLA